MAKSDTLQNGFWENYRFKIQMLSERPKNNGSISEDEAQDLGGELKICEYGSAKYGLKIRLFWVLDEANRVIASRYQIFGPPILLAIADMGALLTRNKTLDEIEKLNYKSLEYFLRDNPVDSALTPELNYSIIFILEALKYAVKSIRGEEIEEETLVCECAGVSKESIESVIREFKLNTPKEVTNYTRAGGFCGECISQNSSRHPRQYTIEDILRRVKKELEEEGKTLGEVPNKPFNQMSLEEKRVAIDTVINNHIRAMLVMDGGDMEILDIKENGEHTDIYIRYLGACSGCASASTGTLFAIEGILKQKLDPNIRVLPL